MAKTTTFKHPPRGHVAGLGYDAVNDRWQAVYVNASGQLSVSVAAGLTDLLTELQQKLETADLLLDSGKRLGVNLYGWDGAAARKLPLLWGYSGTVVQYIYDETLDAGSQLLLGTQVPTGEVWVITSIGLYYVGTQSVTVDARAYISGTAAILKSYVAPGTGRWYADVVQAVLAAGDRMGFYISGNLVNEDLHTTYIGYKMQVNQ